MADWLEMAANAATIGVVAVADQLDLFSMLSKPRTAVELAVENDWSVRHLEEVLFALTAGGLLVHDNGLFALSEAHAAILSDPKSPYFLAGQARALADAMGRGGAIAESVRTGRGVDPATLTPESTISQERLNGPSQSVLLPMKWINAMPDVVKRLDGGGTIADVGCGAGRATEALARRFPNATVTGFDMSSMAIEQALMRTTGEGTDNLTFEERSLDELPEAAFDLVLAYDVVHDLGDPLGGLEAVRRSLKGDGALLMVEPNAADSVDDNIHAMGALLYGLSAMYCVPAALAHGDVGLGACWGPTKAAEFADAAGFGRFERLPIDNVANAFYRLGR